MTTDQLVQCVESIEHPSKDRFLAFLNFFHVTGETFVNFTAEQLAQYVTSDPSFAYLKTLRLAEDDRDVVDCLLVLQGKDTGNSPAPPRRRIIRADEVFSQRSPSPTEGPLSVQIGDEVSVMDEYWEISSLGSPQGRQSVHFETPYDISVQEALRQTVASPNFESTMLRDSVDVDRTSLAAAIDSGSASPGASAASPEGEQTGPTSVAFLFAPSTLSPTMEEDGLSESQLSFRATSDLSSFGPLGTSDHNQAILIHHYPNSDYDRVHIANHIVEPELGATEESIEMGFEDGSINEFDDSAIQGSAGDLSGRHGSDWMVPEAETDIDIVLYPDPCMPVGNCPVDADNYQHDAGFETDTQNNGRDMDLADKLSSSEGYGSEFAMEFRSEETTGRSGLVSQQADGLSHDQSGSIASIVDSLIPEQLAEGDTNGSYPYQSFRESESHVLYSDRERDDVTSIHSSYIDSGASALHDHEPHSLPYILSLDSDDFNVDWSFIYQPETCIPDAPVQLPKIPIEPLAESIDRGFVTSTIRVPQRSRNSFCRRFQSRSLGDQYDGRTFFSQRDTVRPIQKQKYCDIAIQTEKSRADRRAEKLETRVKQLEHEIQTLRTESAKERESFHFGRNFLSFLGPNPLEMDYFSAGGWNQGYDRYVTYI